MSFAAVEQIARAVLYEGYLLYPYRPGALKNRQRWMFGRLLPRDYSVQHDDSEPWSMQTECLVVGDLGTALTLKIRFLQLACAGQDFEPDSPRKRQERGAECAAWITSSPECQAGKPDLQAEPDLPEEAVEREVNVATHLGQIVDRPQRFAFSFTLPADSDEASPADPQRPRGNGLTPSLALRADVPGGREQHQQEVVAPLEGVVEVTAVEVGERLFKLTVVIENLTPCNGSFQRDLDQAQLVSLISTHTMLHVREGQFVSLLDPPASYAAVAGACRNIGTWPVLAGPEPGRLMLSSPIILSDHPQIAPESPGDLCDGAEIDELLTLRILTLTDEEKTQMRLGGGLARRILERTEALSEEQLAQLHGRFQGNPQPQVPSTSGREHTLPPDVGFQPGDHVRLEPRGGADAFDLLLKGQRATVVSIERDFEDRVHLGVVLDDDPGKDFGAQGLPGHRFFFSPEEVERVP
jgi:hydrogenase maturation protease